MEVDAHRAPRRAGKLARALAAGVASLMFASSVVAHDGLHGDDLTLDRMVPAPAGVSQAAATITGTVTPGPRTVAVVLLNFTAAPVEPWTAEEIRSTVFTDPASVNAFEQEQSYGAVSLTGKLSSDGDVFGWYTIDADPGVCDPSGWAAAARAQAASAGVTLAGYQHYIYLFPDVAACQWAGLGSMPGSNVWINGTTSVRVIAHEIGHNLGSHHATVASCVDGAGAPVAFSATCTVQEYGDPFDVMGGAKRQTSAVNKLRLGLIPAANGMNVTASGTYSLSTSSTALAAPQDLRIVRGAGLTPWHVELRSTTGTFDNFAPTDPAVTGVAIRLMPDGAGLRTTLIDTNPQTSTFADAPLGIGRTFTDHATGIAITLLGINGLAASVRVDYPAPTPPSPAPVTPTPAPDAPVTPPPTGTQPPPTWTVTPAPRAAMSVRRIDSRQVLVRVRISAAHATSCRIRAGAGSWTECRVQDGVVRVSRRFPVASSRVRVRVQLNGTPALDAVVRVPARIGRTVATTPALLPSVRSAL